MQKKILVAYASRTGSTAEVAEKIGNTLKDLGASIDVKSVKEISDVSNYDAIIIGSAVRMFKLLPETMEFFKRFSESFKDKPVAYFIVCLTMKEDNDKNSGRAETYLKPLYEVKEPVMVGLFAGKIEFSKLSPLWRWFMKVAKIEEGDFRDWDLIDDWTKRVADILLK